MKTECHDHGIWKSPFMLGLRSDDLPLVFNLASVWAINMVHGSYCFPRYVAALAARAEEDWMRHGLLQNAWDESGGNHHISRSHFWLAVRLSRLLGLSDEEIERIKPLSQARSYTDTHFRICVDGNFDEALGMICLIEEFTTPEFSAIFKAFLRSCEQVIGMRPENFVLNGGSEYFTANIADDERHREEMPILVATQIYLSADRNGELVDLNGDLEGIRAGIRRSIELRLRFFNDIFRFVKKGGTIRDLVS